MWFNANFHVGFEVLTAVVMKSTIFWDIKPCSPLKVNRFFGGKYRLHLQGRRISEARYQHEAGSATCSVLVSSLTFNGLHEVMFHVRLVFSINNVCLHKYY
jgi:uncharacterized protein YjiK